MIEDNPSTPPSILKQAIKAVPAVKYALGIAGILAVIAIVGGFGIDFRVALFGAIIMFVLMTMLVIFASLAKQKGSHFRLPALVFTWFSLICVMALAIVLFTSVFWGRPVDLRRLLGQEPLSVPTAAADDQKEAKCSDVVDAKKIERPEVHLPDPESTNSREVNSGIDERVADGQASYAIEAMAKLASDSGTADECTGEASKALKLWDHAQANWYRALEMTDDGQRISSLKAKLKKDAGITCVYESCAANNTEFYRVELGRTFVVPVGVFPPRSGK